MRYAVIFKTYAWDAFVHRQALRCEAAAAKSDFFIAVDETNGSVGAIPFNNVMRTTNTQLAAAGFACRFEQGSMLWWNPDYVHYYFQEQHCDYDFYVFVEYDAVVIGQIESIVQQATIDRIDLLALPIQIPKQNWFWTAFHQQTYTLAEIQGALICMSVFSRRALELLASRRRAMKMDDQVRYWPNAEVFIPTEIARAGLNYRSLAELGDVSAYQWFPPILEDDLPDVAGTTFLHPVLDRRRYVAALLKTTVRFRSFLLPRSEMWRSLRRFPKEEYFPDVLGAARRRLITRTREKVQRLKLHLRSKATTILSSHF